MAVHYEGGGGGNSLFGTLARGLGLAANFIPGLQPFAPIINAGTALAQGNPAGAVAGLAGGDAPKMFDAILNAPQVPQQQVNPNWQRFRRYR